MTCVNSGSERGSSRSPSEPVGCCASATESSSLLARPPRRCGSSPGWTSPSRPVRPGRRWTRREGPSSRCSNTSTDAGGHDGSTPRIGRPCGEFAAASARGRWAGPAPREQMLYYHPWCHDRSPPLRTLPSMAWVITDCDESSTVQVRIGDAAAHRSRGLRRCLTPELHSQTPREPGTTAAWLAPTCKELHSMSNYRVQNPATGEIVETFPEATDAEIESTVAPPPTPYLPWKTQES